MSDESCPHTIRYGKCMGCGEEIHDGKVTRFPARIVLGEGSAQELYMNHLDEPLTGVDQFARYRLVLERCND